MREEERTLIAREIHDELGQALTGIKMDLFWLKTRVEKAKIPRMAYLAEKLPSMLAQVDMTIDAVRRNSTELRPSILDNLGLMPALEWMVKDFQARTETSCAFHSTLALAKFKPEVATAIFRICQEALTNVARHAGASRVNVLLHRKGENVVLEVSDNGRGISEVELNRPTSLGILGMRERVLAINGRIVFEKKRTGGTRVAASFPKTEALQMEK